MTFVENIILLLPWIIFVSVILLICGLIEKSYFKSLKRKEKKEKSKQINKNFKNQMKILNTDPSEYYDVIDFIVERRKK